MIVVCYGFVLVVYVLDRLLFWGVRACVYCCWCCFLFCLGFAFRYWCGFVYRVCCLGVTVGLIVVFDSGCVVVLYWLV